MTEPFAYKLLTQAQWDAWRAADRFAGAPVDLADGYIHLSARDQVRATAAKWFAGADPLILVTVDLAALGDAVRWELSRGGALFPHVYGTIPLSAVAGHERLALGSGGEHDFPGGF